MVIRKVLPVQICDCSDLIDSSSVSSSYSLPQLIVLGLRDVLMALSQVIGQCFQQNLFTSSSRLLLKRRLEELSSGVGVRDREVCLGLIDLNQTVEKSIRLYKSNIESYLKTIGIQEHTHSAKALYSLCDSLLLQCSKNQSILTEMKSRLGNHKVRRL